MMTEKIKILLIKKNMTVVQLADLLNTKPQNLYNKFRRNNLSEKELIEIAGVLNVKYEGFFFLEGGEKI